MQKKVWVRSKGKSATGIHRAWAQQRGLGNKSSIMTRSLHRLWNCGKAALQSKISRPSRCFSQWNQPPRRTGRDCFNLSGRAKSPAALQQAARCSDAVPAVAQLQPLLPLPPSPRPQGFDCDSAPAANGSEMAWCTLHTAALATVIQPHPGWPMWPVILQKTRVT